MSNESTQEAWSACQPHGSLGGTIKVLGIAGIAGWPWLSAVVLVSPFQAIHLSPIPLLSKHNFSPVFSS